MGTYDDLDVGDTFASPPRVLTEDDVDALVRVGGYTHPLFTDAAYAAASPFGKRPVPGEGILHVMGGSIEQTERFDDTTIALVGFDQVAFTAPAFAGDTLTTHAEVLDKHRRGRRGTITFAWRCVNADGEELVNATARMLFRVAEAEADDV